MMTDREIIATNHPSDCTGLNIPSNLKGLMEAVNFIRNEADRYRLQPEVKERVISSVLEAVGISILHGNNADPKRIVTLTTAYHNEKLTVTVQDEGIGPDWNYFLSQPLPPGEPWPRCRGVYLIRELCDSLQCGEGNSEVMMTFFPR